MMIKIEMIEIDKKALGKEMQRPDSPTHIFNSYIFFLFMVAG